MEGLPNSQAWKPSSHGIYFKNGFLHETLFLIYFFIINHYPTYKQGACAIFYFYLNHKFSLFIKILYTHVLEINDAAYFLDYNPKINYRELIFESLAVALKL